MGLFSPWFLAGLAALALPLWLHLLRQFKRTPQPFSSLMFFERSIQQSSKHRRLRYLALLALRLLLLALLALLFANPFVNRASSGVAAKRLTVVAVDHSFSMRYQNRLAAAKTQAADFIQQLPGSERVQVFLLDSHLAPLTQAGNDKTAATEAVQAIEVGDDISSYGEFARALRVLEQSTGLTLNVHLFTDAQQTSMPAAFSDLLLGPRTRLQIHPVGSGIASNWAVQSVNVPSHVYSGDGVRLTVSVAGWQTKEAQRNIIVALDGKPVMLKQVTVPSSGQVQVEFDGLQIPFGSHRGEVRMEPHDELPNDDSFGFAIEHDDPRKALFLTNPGRGSESFFYKAALEASSATGLKVQQSAFAEALRLDLSQFALVVLSNPGDLDKPVGQALEDYVAKGGSMLIGVGEMTSSLGLVPIAGNKVVATNHAQGAMNKVDPVFSADCFDRVQFLNTPKIELRAGDRVMANLADGSPLLVEVMKGEGKVLLFASTFDNLTSDFPTHSGFVPFVASSGTYLTGGAASSSSIVVGNAIALRQSKSQTSAADVIGPDEKHAFPLSAATSVMSFAPLAEGFYDVQQANGKRLLLAAHADRRESNLEKVSGETLILWSNTNSEGSASSPAPAESTTVQVSLWRFVLIFVLIAAVLESIFAARYLK